MIETLIESRIGLVVTRLTGDVTYDDLIRWLDEADRDDRFSNEFNGISDMRRANLQLVRDDLARLRDYVSSHRLIFGRWAILVEDAKLTALSMIYGREIKGVHEMEIFSSEEAVSAYLEVDVHSLLEKFPATPPTS